MPRPTATIDVDERLLWVVRVPESEAGTARPTTTGHVEEARLRFDALAARITDDPHPDLTDLAALAARIALGALDDLPDLALIGEPFGGEDGTD